MKHIVFFTLSMVRGGAEGVIARICNDYLIKKYKITILTCMNKEVEQQLDDAIDVKMLDADNVRYSNMCQRFLRRRKLLKFALKELKPDILISFLPEPNFLALSVKKKMDFPMIFSIRNDPTREYKNIVYQILMRYYYPMADGAVFQTKEAKEYFNFSNKLIEESTVIPNPLGKEFLNLEPSINRRKEIVSIGRLDTQKNQKMLIRAFAKIVEMYSEYTLHIYGTGPEEETLLKLIENLKLKESVKLCGNVSGIKERIKDSAMFVLCSNYEGMPNALMEALALGIPCIATDCPCGGCSFLIDDGNNGILIPINEEDALVSAMKYVIENTEESESMAKRAIESVKCIYPNDIYEKWDNYIKKYV